MGSPIFMTVAIVARRQLNCPVQRQLSWPVRSSASAGRREGRAPDRRSALADDGAAKFPSGGICRSASRVVSRLNQPKIELDAEPSYFRQTGDALHGFAFTAP